MRISDWSSDVCSSDLIDPPIVAWVEYGCVDRVVHLADLLRIHDEGVVSDGDSAEGTRREITQTIGSVDRYRSACLMVEHLDCATVDNDDVPLGHVAVEDRKSVVWGKGVSVRVDLGGRRIIIKKKKKK